MAPISNIAALNKLRFTKQQIADLMLVEDRARRAALRSGDVTRAAEHDAEITRLEQLMRDAA